MNQMIIKMIIKMI